MDTILVTGGAGFIGSHLVDALLATGHGVRVLDNFSTGRPENLAPHPALAVLTGDVRDPETVARAVAGCAAIYHLAAVASVQASVEDPAGTHQTNFVGTLNLLQAAKGAGVRRFIFASTAATYGNPEQMPVSEATPVAPLTPYGADKLASEHYIDFFRRQHGLQSCIFRFFNIFGPRQDPASPYSGVISIFTDRARAGQPITLFGDGEQTRDFVFVHDLVAILRQALSAEPLPPGPFNIGSGRATSLNRLLAIISAGRDLTIRLADPRPGDIRHSLADNTRLLAAFGPRQFTPIEAGLRELL